MKVNNNDLHNLALSIGPTNNIYASPMMKKIQQKKNPEKVSGNESKILSVWQSD